jgi:ubiquinone/menaquinone biosynthesis C-methylase UbiE
VITGDHGAGAERVNPVLEDHPPDTRIVLEDYNAVSWADVACEHGDRLVGGLHEFIAAVEARVPLRNVRPSSPTGSVAGVSYRASGEGPPLVLFPLGLSPSQWAPVVDRLGRDYCVIQVGGAHIEPTSFLEARGRNPGYRAVVGAMLDALDLAPDGRLLELGCGSGAVTRWISERMAHRVRITGLDVNKFLLSEAAALRDAEAQQATIEFLEGNAEHIPFPDDSFDATVSITMLEEVDADRAIAEMVRVTRPGGRVGAVTRSLDMTPVISAALDEKILAKLRRSMGSIAPGGCADVSLYRRFQQAGLRELQKRPQFNLTAHLLDNTRSRMSVALDAGELAAWDALVRSNDEAFFYAQPMHMAVGTKPQPIV